MDHLATFSHAQTRFVALGPRLGQLHVAQVEGFASRRSRFGQIFEFLGGLVIYSSYQVQGTTCLKSFHFLCTYPGKVFSAWTEVWTGTWPSSASIMASGGRDLGDF